MHPVLIIVVVTKLKQKVTFCVLLTPGIQNHISDSDGFACFLFQLVNSLKHISQSGSSMEPKYITRQDVESEVGSVQGWEEFLICTGFHFIGGVKEVLATVVYPLHDDSGLQGKAQEHLEALLGIPAQSLKALSTLSKFPEVAKGMLTAVSSYCTCVHVILTLSLGIDMYYDLKIDITVRRSSDCQK